MMIEFLHFLVLASVIILFIYTLVEIIVKYLNEERRVEAERDSFFTHLVASGDHAGSLLINQDLIQI